jgi:hypothetical protein
MQYAVEQRLRLIEFLVVHYDSVGRDQLIDFFGISAPQATRDFRAYKALAPDNLLFDETVKKYKKSHSFRRIYE